MLQGQGVVDDINRRGKGSLGGRILIADKGAATGAVDGGIDPWRPDLALPRRFQTIRAVRCCSVFMLWYSVYPTRGRPY